MADESELPTAYTLTPADGEPQESSWDFTGTGLAKYINGDTYEGAYVDGKKEGEGVYTHRDGTVFTGPYKNDQRHGKGKLVGADGSHYEGEFVDGHRNGIGSCRYKNGDVYTGEWSNSQKHGSGIYQYRASKHRMVGDWVKGEIKVGKMMMPNSKKLEGVFSENQPHGDMKWTKVDGTWVHVHFTQTKHPTNDHEHEHLVTKIRLAAKDAKSPAEERAQIKAARAAVFGELKNALPDRMEHLRAHAAEDPL